MKVRAKFKCVRVSDNPDLEQKTISFEPVMNDCEENKSFAKYTPDGRLEMCVSYETEAINAFEENKEYYLDFSPAIHLLETKNQTFTNIEIEQLQSAIHKITGDGEVMGLFNKLLGIQAG